MIRCYHIFLFTFIICGETFKLGLFKLRIIVNKLKENQLTIRLNDTKKIENNDEFQPKLDFAEDFYSVLEISPQSDSQTIKKSYYKMVFKYHPDNKIGDQIKERCNKQMMIINAAYKVLRDEKLRERYDIKRRYGYFGCNAGIKENHSQSKDSENKNPSTSSPKKNPNDAKNENNEYKDRSYSNQSATKQKPTSDYTSCDVDQINEQQTESFTDILSDIWKDLSYGKGATIFGDLNDFLEQNINKTEVDFKYIDPERLNSEVLTLKSVLKHLLDRSNDLKSSIAVEEAILKLFPNESTESARKISAMEAKLSRIEALQGMKARLVTVNRQVKDLQKDLDFALAIQLKESYTKTVNKMDNSNNNVKDNIKNDSVFDNFGNIQNNIRETSKRRPSTDLIDIEMQKLKEKMNFKK